VEKPTDPNLLDELKLPEYTIKKLQIQTRDDLYLASMGIYVFNRKTLKNALNSTEADFGKHIIPGLIKSYRVLSYIYQGYWEDIGTIHAFFEANLNLCEPIPQFNFFDVTAPIFSRPRFLPASKIIRSELNRALIADGCVITDSKIERSVVGVRSRIEENCVLTNCVIMGLDYFETDQDRLAAEAHGLPGLGIGKNCKLEHVIVDKNARIGDNVTITRKSHSKNFDGENYYIRDGIVVIPKGAIVKNGTVI
jgi:glucose-1-phosphate adenylyltransferase